MSKKIGVIYGRVSSEDQDYTRQVEELSKWAVALDIEVSKVFVEKISGSRTEAKERPQYMEMLRYIEDNSIKHILCHEVSRLGRNNKEVVDFFENTVKNKICLYIKKDNLITLDDQGNKTTTATLTINILSALGEMEAEQLATRIKSGKISAAKQGGDFNGKIYGYDSVDKRPQVNEVQAKNVRTIFNMLAKGIGSRSIAAHLNANVGDKKWTPAAVHSIARNSFFKGERKYKDIIIPVPSIVSSELWQKANDSIDSKKQYAGNNTVNVNLLQGLIKCKKCGSTMHQVVNPSQRANLYKCSNGCKTQINRPWLYFVVRQHVEEYAKASKDADKRKQLQTDKELKQAEIVVLKAEIEKVKKRLSALLDVYLDGDISKENYHEKKDSLESQINAINTKIFDYEGFIRSVDNTLSSDISHFSTDEEVFKSELASILEHVLVWEGMVEIQIKGWFKFLFRKRNGAEIGWMIRNGEFRL
ncbi:recombinase family protein [Draconibacterium mangrovi]|uniref:recombinase family protein n=1 Tax=Draconibacterium mangrovi TaxID=2697469 RepID=UPI0013D8C8E7|nr:recombinase family protein [Draconibacterium mangrovi]